MTPAIINEKLFYSQMKVVTKRLILRDLKLSDVAQIALHANNIKIAKQIFSFPFPYSLNDAKSFVKKCMQHTKEKPRGFYEFGIVLKTEKKVIGMISLTKVDRFHGTTTMGYWLGEKYWRKGYMTEALEKMIAFTFTKLKLRRINIMAITSNNASTGLIRKMGFRHEGTMIKDVRNKATGKIHDHHFYGMLKEEWDK